MVTPLVIGAAAIAALVEIVSVWRVVRMGRTLRRIDERVGRFAHSIELLTGTTEGCFNAIAEQLEALVPVPVPPAELTPVAPPERRTVSPKRARAAGRRGLAAKPVAVEEEVSDAEFALRMHLARSRAAAAEGSDDAALCS